MNIPEIFESTSSLRAAFESGLERQLNEDALGTFILVLANALFDDVIFERLREQLESGFNLRKQAYSEKLKLGKRLDDAPDDMVVFLKLIAMGFENLNVTSYRSAGKWEFQFNQLRSLRPSRNSSVEINRISSEFNPEGFHFNKPFLDKEVFWTGEIDGLPLKLLYNKFPFAMMHGLLVPEPDANHPQFLSPDIHRFISRFCDTVGNNMPEIAIAYNAYGAGASVNHLHFQTFTRQSPLPVQNKGWKHNGGGDMQYPVECNVFTDADMAWNYISSLHRENITYNLLYVPGRTLCIPRRYQGSFTMPEWSETFAWYELCGGITTFNADDFMALDEKTVTSALELVKV